MHTNTVEGLVAEALTCDACLGPRVLCGYHSRQIAAALSSRQGEAVAWQGRGNRDGVIGRWHDTTREEYAYHKANKTPGYEVRELFDAPTPPTAAAVLAVVCAASDDDEPRHKGPDNAYPAGL